MPLQHCLWRQGAYCVTGMPIAPDVDIGPKGT
jgi:hypothetical protein